MPRKPFGDRPLTNAERQARHRAARAASQPLIHYRPAADRHEPISTTMACGMRIPMKSAGHSD